MRTCVCVDLSVCVCADVSVCVCVGAMRLLAHQSVCPCALVHVCVSSHVTMYVNVCTCSVFGE